MSALPPPSQPPDTPEPAGPPARATVARNASVMAGATFAARIATFALAIVMGRLLGAEEYGLYGLAFAIVTLVLPIADLGLTPYLIREVARGAGQAEPTVRACLRVKVLTTAVVVLGGGALALLLAPGPLGIALAILLLATGADAGAQFVFGYFQGQERMGFQAASTAITSLVRSVGGIALVLAFDRLTPVLLWIALTSCWQLSRCALRMRAALAEAPPEEPADAGPAIRWGSVASMGLVTVFAMIYLRADSILLGAIRSQREVGFYTGAYTLMSALQILPWMIAVAVGPVFARTFGRDRGAFARSWHDGLRAVLVVSLPMALAVSLVATPVMTRLYGQEFEPAGAALAILVWSSPVWAANMVVSAVLRGSGRERWLTIVTGVGVVLNVGLNIWLIGEHGMRGAASVTVATEAAVLLVLAGLALRRGIVPPPRMPYAGMALALGALAATTVLLRGVSPELALVAGGAAYVAVALATRTVRVADLRGLRAGT